MRFIYRTLINREYHLFCKIMKIAGRAEILAFSFRISRSGQEHHFVLAFWGFTDEVHFLTDFLILGSNICTNQVSAHFSSASYRIPELKQNMDTMPSSKVKQTMMSSLHQLTCTVVHKRDSAPY